MRLPGKAENKAGSGVQGQGCELNMGSNASLAPAEGSYTPHPSGAKSPRGDSIRPRSLCTEVRCTYLHIYAVPLCATGNSFPRIVHFFFLLGYSSLFVILRGV